MALKMAFLCFQFDTLDGISHEPALEHNFLHDPPMPGEAMQPIVAEAVARVKRAIAASISSWFNFGQTRITNISNFLHTATLTFNTEISHTDGSTGQTSIVIVIKFYRMENEDSYRVTLDIEEMHSSAIGAHEESAFRDGFTNKQVELLADLLDREFGLEGRIEYMPLIERGRIDKLDDPAESDNCTSVPAEVIEEQRESL
jgi:hypothetical protein